MRTKPLASCALLIILLALPNVQVVAEDQTIHEVVTRSELQFQPLNPARGNASPQAGVLWGDIRKNKASGVLLKFADGFSSPPHIHNITYRAVVITGAVHNDDPDAEKMWMGPGSFWTQPAGEVHITAAQKGTGATAFLEILEGPYLVQPAKGALDNGERPLNLEARNIVWLNASDVTWIKMNGQASTAEEPKVAFLWGKPWGSHQNGTFLKLPTGFKGKLHAPKAWLRAVMIQGTTHYKVSGISNLKKLESGSYFGSKGKTVHEVTCMAQDDCIIYVRTEGNYVVTAP